MVRRQVGIVRGDLGTSRRSHPDAPESRPKHAIVVDPRSRLQQLYDQAEELSFVVGRPVPWPMEAHTMEAVLHRESRNRVLVLSVVAELGPMSEEIWTAVSAWRPGVRLLPSGPNLWCLSGQLMLRAPIQVRMCRRELFELARGDAPTCAGVILCGQGVVRRMERAFEEHRFWRVLKAWAKELGPDEIAQHDLELLARHDRKMLTRAEMQHRAAALLRRFDMEAGLAAEANGSSRVH